MKKKRILLIIMDGWGLGKVASSDAIQHAKTPFVSSLYSRYAHTTLVTCGEDVGLPDGQMGNSEVGHLNLGAGRIVYQELQRINVAIRNGEFYQNLVLRRSVRYAIENNKPLHLIGLVSDGGVHSHITHVKAITSYCAAEGLKELFVHAFTDGRDTNPKSGKDFIADLQAHMKETVGTIASISGRYYAMDRDNRWERVKLAYNAIVMGEGEMATDALTAIGNAYANNITDEFFKPTVMLGEDQLPIATLKDGDVAICFNFRTDRCREISQVLTQSDMPTFNMHKLNIHYTTMAEYDKTFTNVHVVFETDNLVNTLGAVLAAHDKKQVRMAETEKYPHVTFFFSGGREVPYVGEKRLMVPSPKVATYDLQPEMSAYELTDLAVAEIAKNESDFFCINFANADMVGHTGIWDAVVKAVETVDACVNKVVTTALEKDYTIFLTADHGNADYMINEYGSPNTAHTLNLVPFFIIDKEWKETLTPGKLGDLAPTILRMMQLPVPAEMTGNILINLATTVANE
ncbi:MAG: 2,3-bisphosphoglycerate-independent phosphoglycerate mutase [Chitinophagaceae bacterium]